MEHYREIEAIRRPGSPQLDVTKVRGSWRDYLDPIDYSDIDEIESDFLEFNHFESYEDDEEFIMDSFDFEPFSDTCGECDNEGEETDTDMEGLDLTLFEPIKSSDKCKHNCCCSCINNAVKGDCGYLLISVPVIKSGEYP